MGSPDYHVETMRSVGPVFFLIWLLFVIGAIVGWIVFLVAVWRGMKAHESIAESVKKIAEKQ